MVKLLLSSLQCDPPQHWAIALCNCLTQFLHLGVPVVVYGFQMIVCIYASLFEYTTNHFQVGIKYGRVRKSLVSIFDLFLVWGFCESWMDNLVGHKRGSYHKHKITCSKLAPFYQFFFTSDDHMLYDYTHEKLR